MFAYRRTLYGRRVLVSLKTDSAVRGFLVSKRGPIVVIKAPELLEARLQPTPIDGEVVIERSNIDFIQVIPEG